MEKSSIIIGIILLLSAIVPIWLINKMSKSNNNKLLKQIGQLIKQRNLTPGFSEQFRNKAMGIDAEHQNLLFVKQNEDRTVFSEVIELDNLKQCVAEQFLRSVQRKGAASDKVTDRVCLNFLYVGDKPAKKVVELYSRENDAVPDNDWERAKKWEALVNKSILSKSKSFSHKSLEPIIVSNKNKIMSYFVVYML
jgi:hypothetical protein